MDSCRRETLFLERSKWCYNKSYFHDEQLSGKVFYLQTGPSEYPSFPSLCGVVWLKAGTQRMGANREPSRKKEGRANLKGLNHSSTRRCDWAGLKERVAVWQSPSWTAVGMLVGWQHALFFPVICQKWAHCFVNLPSLHIFVDALYLASIHSGPVVLSLCFYFRYFLLNLLCLFWIPETETNFSRLHGFSFFTYKMGIEEGCIFHSVLCPKSRLRFRSSGFLSVPPTHTHIFTKITKTLSLSLSVSFSLSHTFILHNNPMENYYYTNLHMEQPKYSP